MKRVLAVILLVAFAAATALATVPQPSLVQVRQTHQRTQHHRAHRSAKHRNPNRHRHTV